MTECFVCMRAVRTRPFESGNVSMTPPMNQALRGKVGSAINTTSLNERLRRGFDHLFRF